MCGKEQLYFNICDGVIYLYELSLILMVWKEKFILMEKLIQKSCNSFLKSLICL